MTDEFRTILENALSEDNLAVLQTLLSNFKEIPEEDQKSIIIKTTVNVQSVETLINLLKIFFDAGYDFSFKDEQNRNFLHIAAANDNPEIITYFLDKGLDLESRSDTGVTPLHMAAINADNPKVLETLINAGADIYALDNSKSNLLMSATQSDTADIIKYVQEVGHFEPGLKDEDGWSAIMYAARWAGSMDIITFLEDCGEDFYEKTPTGGNLLHLAATNSNVEIVEYLVKFFCTDDVDNDGITPMRIALELNDNPEVIEVMLRAQKEENLYKASLNSNPNILFSLLENGYDPNQATLDLSRPIFYVAKGNDNPKVMEVLIRAGAILSVKDYWGRTVLHYAAANEDTSIYDWLLENYKDELDVDAKDKSDNTAEYIKAHPQEF